jgi:hypothetical protein
VDRPLRGTLRMTERDSDIEFDFFDEPETQEATQRRRAPRDGGGPRGPRPPRRPVRPTAEATRLLRLAGLVAFAIFLVVVLVLVVKSCRNSSKNGEYADYMTSVRTIGSGSAGVGRQLNDVLTTPGIKEADLETKLNGLAQQQSQYADRAERVDPPGPLRVEHQHLIEALQLRTSGISRLATAFRQTAKSKNATQAGQLLAKQALLLVASDVNWNVYFRNPSLRELQRQGITGVSVPESKIFSNTDLASTASMTPVWRRVHGAATSSTTTPSGVHGVGLVSTKVLPGGQQLTPTTETTITASPNLAFEVAVKDTGEAQEVKVPVTLTIEKKVGNRSAPIVKRGNISLIDVGATQTITFHITEQPPFSTPTKIKVQVGPVPAEKTFSNNTATYPVIFSFGP